MAPYGPTVVWTSDGSTGGQTMPAFDEEKGDRSRLLNAGVELMLGRKHDLRNMGGLPTLRISVWGHERIAKERPLGIAILDLAVLPQDGATVEKWMELEPAVGMVPDTPCGRCVPCAPSVFDAVGAWDMRLVLWGPRRLETSLELHKKP